MAKLLALPSLAIIGGFKGTIDYYVHDGIPCARKWPRSPGKKRTPEVEAGWPAFSWAASTWKYLSPEVQQAYNQMAQGTIMTGRDIFSKSFINGESLILKDV